MEEGFPFCTLEAARGLIVNPVFSGGTRVIGAWRARRASVGNWA